MSQRIGFTKTAIMAKPLMQPSLIFRRNIGFVNRENRVPYYQKLYQTTPGRIWSKSPRAKYMLYPYYALLSFTFSGSMYMMVRLVLGHKTWFSAD
ncbi:hypothetical protein XPA_006411 [Xanthoria parietina]